MIFSPKLRFQANKDDLANHAKLVATGSFLRALDAALLQMQNERPYWQNDVVPAAAEHHRIEGAREFIRELLCLAEEFVPKPSSAANTRYNLDHTLK